MGDWQPFLMFITASILHDYFLCPHRIWRDQAPSGALSIEWYNKYLETKDPKVLQKIINYNEDDCKATMIIKDKLAEMMKV